MTEVHTDTVPRERVADYQGKPVGLGSNTEEVVEKLKAGKGLVEKIAGSLLSGIEFQKIWKIEEKEIMATVSGNMAEVLISKGARHTEDKLDGIVGYDFQDGYVVVLQTVLEGGIG